MSFARRRRCHRRHRGLMRIAMSGHSVSNQAAGRFGVQATGSVMRANQSPGCLPLILVASSHYGAGHHGCCTAATDRRFRKLTRHTAPPMPEPAHISRTHCGDTRINLCSRYCAPLHVRSPEVSMRVLVIVPLAALLVSLRRWCCAGRCWDPCTRPRWKRDYSRQPVCGSTDRANNPAPC